MSNKMIDMSVVMRSVGRTRMHKNVELSLKIVPLPDKPGVPTGSWGWMIMEFDPFDDNEAVVVGGAQPNAAAAAALGAEVLQCEIARRKLPSLLDLDLIAKAASK